MNHRPDVLLSDELLTIETAAEIYQRHQVPGTRERFRHDVRVHRITHCTVDVDGTSLTASAAILVPQRAEPLPTLCYLRGTIIPVHWERRAPSYYDLRNDQSIYENYEPSFLAAGFASAGYFAVVPDLIGYGASRDREHPYMHAPSLAWAARDGLQAAEEFARGEGIELARGVYVTGWSEGGLAGLALHQLLESERRDEFPVRGTSVLAGCCALSAMIDWFCSLDEPYPEQEIYYWMLRSMNRVVGVNRPFDQIVRPAYAAGLTRDVLAPVPVNPRDGLDPHFRARLLDHSDAAMRRAFEDSDRYDWRPLAPVFLHHGTHDDVVPFFTSQMAFQAMRARGGSAWLYPYLGMDHYQPVNAYTLRTLADFDAIGGHE